jgi:hypothetical protein
MKLLTIIKKNSKNKFGGLKNPPYFCQNNNTMAKAFRPYVWVEIPYKYSGKYLEDVRGGVIQKSFETYSKLKTNLKRLLKDSINNEVRVYRHRRGEWGEWFEHWNIVDGKPKIVKEGWQ